MLKDRLIAITAATAIVGGALATNLLPDFGRAQQTEGANPPAAEQQDTGAAKEEKRLLDPAMFVPEQQDAEIQASFLIGQPLYNQQAEVVGGIKDLIIGEDGTLQAVVIGVGGFLGIGEKGVAVRYNAISTTRQAESDQMLLVIDATAEELKSAPEYQTLAMKLAKEQAEKAAQQPAAGAPQPLEQPAPSN